MVAEQDLDQRYGKRRGPLSPAQRWALIVVALLLGTLATYVVYRNAQPEVTGNATSWVVSSATEETINWEVDKPAGATVSCVIRARNEAGAEVGRRSVTVTTHGKHVHVTTRLPTTGLAITGEVEDCVVGTSAS